MRKKGKGVDNMKTKSNRETTIAEAGLKRKPVELLIITICSIILLLSVVFFYIPFLIVGVIFLCALALNGFIYGRTFYKDGLVIHRFFLPNKAIYWYEITQLDLTTITIQQEIKRKGYVVYGRIEGTQQILVMSQALSIENCLKELEDILKDYPFLIDRFISTGLKEGKNQEFEKLLENIKHSIY